MRTPREIVSDQFRRPAGLLGHAAARFMRKRNRNYYSLVVQKLEIRDKDHVLEIGFGEGLAIREIAERNSCCRIDGIDFSKVMFRKAERATEALMKTGRLKLTFGNFMDFDFSGSTYSKIFAINVVYFWPSLNEPFAKIYSLLKTGGRLVILLSSPERLEKMPFAADGVFSRHTLEQVYSALRRAGFQEFSCDTTVKRGFELYCVRADKK
jgi:SAM-dependent methyltransferase